jgi:hypothetical protein
MAAEAELVQFRSRELVIDDGCRERAAAAGCDPVEQRLWEAGFTREAAREAAENIAADAAKADGAAKIPVDTPS